MTFKVGDTVIVNDRVSEILDTHHSPIFNCTLYKIGYNENGELFYCAADAIKPYITPYTLDEELFTI